MRIDELVPPAVKAEFPDINPGDSVKVHCRIIEGDKERIQIFQGIVLRKRAGADGGNFTVRRLSYGIGVERIFPFASPLIAKIEMTRRGRVRRAKLYYLRGLTGKAARIKEGDRETAT
jgi:large subunit ribosomal protein L19